MLFGKYVFENRHSSKSKTLALAMLLVLMLCEQSVGYEATSVTNGGSVNGKIIFNGEVPSPKSFDLDKFPQPKFCGKVDSDEKGHRLLHDVNVGKDGVLADVVVSIENIEKGKPFKFAGTDTNADICRFLVQNGPSKFVGVAMKKAEFRVKNLDADPTDPKAATGVLHNPHLYEELGSSTSTIFNLPLPNKDQVINKPTILRKKGSFLHMQCDQHNYMNTYYYPVENPYYAVVGADGTFGIDGIPPGDYELHAWHPILGIREAKINITAGGTVTQNFSYGIKEDNHKLEKNTETATVVLNSTISTLPDLEMTSVAPKSDAVDAGTTLSVTDGVINQGLASSDSFTIAYYLSVSPDAGPSDSILLPTSRMVDTLGPGFTNTATTNLSIPATTPANSYYVCSDADSENNVIETDKNNNTLCSSNQVIVRQPDLIVSGITTAATVKVAGQSVPLNISIKNQGNAPAGPSLVSFYLSTNAVYGNRNDIVSSTTKEIGYLNSGAISSGTISMMIPESTHAGSYYLCAAADSENTVVESNEDNNTACTALLLRVPLPDLVIIRLSTSAATIRNGEAFFLTATIQNRGGSATSPFKIDFVLSKNATIGDEDDIALTPELLVRALGVGASSKGTVKLAVPEGTPVGDYHIGTIININRSELDGETNRLSSAKITISH
jgi:hypothetical protein